MEGGEPGMHMWLLGEEVLLGVYGDGFGFAGSWLWQMGLWPGCSPGSQPGGAVEIGHRRGFERWLVLGGHLEKRERDTPMGGHSVLGLGLACLPMFLEMSGSAWVVQSVISAFFACGVWVVENCVERGGTLQLLCSL